MEQQDLRQKTKEKFLNERIGLYLSTAIRIMPVLFVFIMADYTQVRLVTMMGMEISYSVTLEQTECAARQSGL